MPAGVTRPAVGYSPRGGILADDEPRFRIDDFRKFVRTKYADVAEDPTKGFHFPSGRDAARQAGYPPDLLAGIPEEAVESFCGAGNPFSNESIHAGETVVDLGCGAGMDALIAARMVGREGEVIGLDVTPQMVTKARKAAATAGVSNVRFVEGLAEALPMSDATVDVILSNGAINLIPDKPAVFAEMFRVLRPGGRVLLVDLLASREVPRSVRDLIYRWTSCVAGSVMDAEFQTLLVGAGFTEIEVGSPVDIFDGAQGELNADHYGVLGLTIRACKPKESTAQLPAPSEAGTS